MLTLLLLTMVVALGAVAPRASASSDGWWNTSWNYRRAVTVENPNPFELIQYPVSIALDTQSLISAGKMKPDGSDLRLLRDGEEIDFAVIDFNTSNTKIAFKSSVPASGNNPNYTLYYGNPLASAVNVTYEKIKYEVIDEFNDGVIDPMWNFSYGGYPGVVEVPTHYESDGSLCIEKGPVANIASAYTTGINVNNSEVLRVRFRAETGEVGWAGYNGVYNWLTVPGTGAWNIYFWASTYDKSPNSAGPGLGFMSITGEPVSTEINASRIDWTQLNYQWYNYELYWNESSNFARIAMDGLYYDNENTNGYLEDYSFDLWLGAGAYAPSGTSYAKFDYIRVWQEVSIEPTTSVGTEETQLPLGVTATVDINPHALNLWSRGRWITAYIELPEGYNIADIDISTIKLNDTIPAEPEPTEIGDYDNDTIPDLMVKFNRTAVSEYILSKGIMTGNVTLTITGQLIDGTQFEGSNVIQVRMPGDINIDGKVNILDAMLAAQAFGSYPEHRRWNYVADENEDNQINILDLILIAKNFGKTYP